MVVGGLIISSSRYSQYFVQMELCYKSPSQNNNYITNGSIRLW